MEEAFSRAVNLYNQNISKFEENVGIIKKIFKDDQEVLLFIEIVRGNMACCTIWCMESLRYRTDYLPEDEKHVLM